MNFIRTWNQNRKQIIIAILIVAFAILLIRAINSIVGLQRRNAMSNLNVVNTTISDSSIPTESVVSGEYLTDELANRNANTIKEFINFCNIGDYKNAYNLLSTENKEEVFKTAEDFKTEYVDKIFSNAKTYELELWFSNNANYTYRVLYYDNNILSTGQLNLDKNIEDYITVVTDENHEAKLNINGFIDKDNLNKSEEIQDLKITIDDRMIYRSYETYRITIENKSDKTIILAEEKNGNDICLIDNNQVEYDSIISEIPPIDLQIQPYSIKTINIKFNKMYGQTRTIEQMLFKGLIMDKNEFENDSENYVKLKLGIII